MANKKISQLTAQTSLTGTDALVFERGGTAQQITFSNVSLSLAGTYAPLVHTHVIADVTNLQASLDAKAALSHTHAISDVTNLQTTLDGKCSLSHTHIIADTTGLQTALNNKADVTHTHVVANITDFASAISGLALATHKHSAADITSGTLPIARGGTGLTATGNSGQLLAVDGTGLALTYIDPPSGGGGGGGGVSSVSLNAPATIFAVTGSPVTSSGTLKLNFATAQTKNLVLCTDPSSGDVGFASLANSHLPTVDFSHGGTGLTALGNALEVLRVNGTKTGLEFAAASGGITTADTPVNGDGLVYNGSAWKTSPYLPPTRYTTTWRNFIAGTDPNFGFLNQSNPNLNGTGSEAFVQTATGYFDTFTTGATSGNAGGASGLVASMSYQQKPRFFIKFRTGSSIANIRLWIGVSNNPSTSFSSADPANHQAALRFDTGAGDSSTWRTYTNDGTAGGTITNSAASIAINTTYQLCIDMTDPANILFYLDGVLINTHSANLPGASTAIAGMCTVTTLTTAARSLGNATLASFVEAQL